VTTKSSEAYRSYLEGVELNDKFYSAEAMAAFKKAIELDSNFAMAYFGLANVNNFVGDNEEARRLLTKAWQLKDNVNERERLIIQSRYVAQIENNPQKAVEILETIIQKYPHQQGTYLALGFTYARLGQLDKSVHTYQRGLAVDSLDKNLWNVLAYGNIALNKKQDALDAINHYVHIAPAEPNPYDSKGDIYFGFGDLDSAEYWWRKALTFRSDFPSARKIGYLDLIHNKHDEGEKLFSQFASSQGELQEVVAKEYPLLVSSYKGQLNKTFKQLDELLPSLIQHKNYHFMSDVYSHQAMMYYEQGNYPAMLEVMKKRTTEIPHRVGQVYGRYTLALAYLKNGKKDMATQVIREIERDIPNPLPQEQAELDYYTALAAYEEGKYDEAVRQFKKALQFVYQVHAPQYFYAVSLLKSGHTAEAIDELQRATWWVSFDNDAFDLNFLPVSANYVPISTTKAHYWLGVAYEQQDDKDKAIKSYEKFLELWKDADFKSKELDNAKVRLSKLKGLG
jgi:tetratricopeptide (TPR) repeat protein